jgi:hypothetical protein
MALDKGSLDAIDDYAPHAELAHDLVERRLAHEEFLSCVRYKRFRQSHTAPARAAGLERRTETV